jgi:MFS family permease
MIPESPRADRWRSASARRDHHAGHRLYHGWKVVACAFLIAVFGWGFGFYGIGVFLAELVEHHAWATSSVASAVTVLYLVGAALIACVGNAFERFGPRRVVLVGMAAMGAAAIGLTWITHVWQLYLVFPLMAAGWAAMSGAALNIIVAPWFERRRGLAISLASTGRPWAGSCSCPHWCSSSGGSDSGPRCWPWWP